MSHEANPKFTAFPLFVGLVLALTSCHAPQAPAPIPAVPVQMHLEDRTFFSSALKTRATCRTLFSSAIHPSEPIHILYLLHGNGGSYTEWSTSSRIIPLAGPNFILVMPEGRSSYFMNFATGQDQRYEDFVTEDLIHEVEADLPPESIDRAIIGNSMGGFAALVIAFHHPALFHFAAALSPPIDYPERTFTFHRLGQSMAIRRIFGPPDSPTRIANDPFHLAATATPGQLPYIFLSAGSQESLLAPIQRFDRLLTARHIPHTFHTQPGGHDWTQWNLQLPDLLQSLNRSSHPLT